VSAPLEPVVLAAVIAAGSDDPEKVAEHAARIAAMCTPGSPVARAVEGVRRSKVFTAVVARVEREDSSTRALVTLRTKPSRWHEDGVEQARTERTDSGGLPLARRLLALTGHRVLLWVEVEDTGTSKVRVIRHVEDLGEEAADD
jgi:hypothetical protein